MSNYSSRRDFIKTLLLGFGALSVPVAFSGCDDNNNDTPAVVADFLHGVASGDPLQNSVILWTRLTPAAPATRLIVRWEIATDDQFKNIVQSNQVETTAAADYTVKIDAQQLQANTTYYYRFKYNSTYSPVGRTKTLPTQANTVKFAVCSCSNYPAGYFYVFREMAKQDVDVVLHLGDYIYEYGQGGYASGDAAKLGRTLTNDNSNEIIKLDDYRKRYALYRQDKDLQAVHQRHPFIAVWDDHEVANDAWRNGAENHQANEGDFLARKLAAIQAYFEWMPIRPIAQNEYNKIYRQFNFGQLVQLNMLDTRLLARDQQLNYNDYITAQGFNAVKFQTDLTNPTRTMMGTEQLKWLQTQLAQSTATWNVLGQQVLMAKMFIPAEMLQSLAAVTSGTATAATLATLNQQISELVSIKMRLLKKDPTLTAAEKARVTNTIPYNLDAWDGYYYEREVLYGTLKQLNKKAVVLAGDTHNGWFSQLRSQSGDVVGVELATSSVTSPGLEEYIKIPLAQLQQFEMGMVALVDELQYCNLNQRGFVVVNFDAQSMNAQWIYLNDIKTPDYKVDATRQFMAKMDINGKILTPTYKSTLLGLTP